MAVMDAQGLISWTMANPDAGTALATMALVAVGFLVGLGQIGIVFYGIKKMSDGNEERAAQHKAAMEAETNRHKEAMTALNALIRNTARHNRPVHAR